MRSYLSVAMPETCPRIQLFGSGFGQNGSTWNCGSGLAVWAYAGPATSTTVTLSHAIIIFMLVVIEHRAGLRGAKCMPLKP
jgi:hypothetical protein